MKLVVGSKSYDITETLEGSSLGDLLKLKVKTKTAEFTGVSVRTIQQTFVDTFSKLGSGEFDGLSLLEDEAFLQNMIGLIWLAGRKAGEQIELEDAAATPFDQFHLEDDEDEAEELPKDEAVESTDLSVQP